MRTDADGEMLWFSDNVLPEWIQIPSGTDYYVHAMTAGPPGKFAIVGLADHLEKLNDYFIFQVDEDGNVEWYRRFSNAAIYGVTYTQQGTYMTVGNGLGHVLQLSEIDTDGEIVN